MRRRVTAQHVRILDVIVIGPLLLFAASHRTLPDWLRVSLAATGVATVLYNGLRYLNVARAATPTRRG